MMMKMNFSKLLVDSFWVSFFGMYAFLTVMASGDGTTPLIVEEFVKKTSNAINGMFYKCYQNPLGQIKKKKFKTLSALGACHVTIIGGVVYKKLMIFKVFGVYLSEFLIFHHEIFFGSKILSSSCDKHQNFD